jgi:hypothetical protein
MQIECMCTLHAFLKPRHKADHSLSSRVLRAGIAGCPNGDRALTLEQGLPLLPGPWLQAPVIVCSTVMSSTTNVLAWLRICCTICGWKHARPLYASHACQAPIPHGAVIASCQTKGEAQVLANHVKRIAHVQRQSGSVTLLP